MKKVLCLLLVCIIPQYFWAQEASTNTNQSDTNIITINKDPRLDLLSAKQKEINLKTSMLTSSGQVKGYRIQVINSNRRDEADRFKAELLLRFPEEKTYLTYQAPNFRVRIGNFIELQDAQKFRKRVAKLYPGKGIYVVSDIIDYTFTDGFE
jgi:hypothetical protein